MPQLALYERIEVLVPRVDEVRAMDGVIGAACCIGDPSHLVVGFTPSV